MEANFWTVGSVLNNPETLEHARARAERECLNTKKVVYLYKLIDAVHPETKTVATWDSAQQPATPPAAAEPERFRVGDVVDAARRYLENVPDPSSFERATIVEIDNSDVPYMIAWQSGGTTWKHAFGIRRPVAAPVPCPFVFGERVDLYPAPGQGYSCKSAIFVRDNANDTCEVLVDKPDSFVTRTVNKSQVHHIVAVPSA